MLAIRAGFAVTVGAIAVVAIIVVTAEAAATTAAAIATAAIGTDAAATAATAGRIDRATIAALGGVVAEIDIVERDVGVLPDEQAAAETRTAATAAGAAITAARNRIDDGEVLERHLARGDDEALITARVDDVAVVLPAELIVVVGVAVEGERRAVHQVDDRQIVEQLQRAGTGREREVDDVIGVGRSEAAADADRRDRVVELGVIVDGIAGRQRQNNRIRHKDLGNMRERPRFGRYFEKLPISLLAPQVIGNNNKFSFRARSCDGQWVRLTGAESALRRFWRQSSSRSAIRRWRGGRPTM